VAEIVEGKFDNIKKNRRIILSRLANGDYRVNAINHYKIEIDGHLHIFGIQELIDAFGHDLKIGQPKYTRL
jgi:hypothetical protein